MARLSFTISASGTASLFNRLEKLRKGLEAHFLHC